MCQVLNCSTFEKDVQAAILLVHTRTHQVNTAVFFMTGHLGLHSRRLGHMKHGHIVLAGTLLLVTIMMMSHMLYTALSILFPNPPCFCFSASVR
jgi:hypothetical protein